MKGTINKKFIALGILLAVLSVVIALYIYVIGRSTATPVKLLVNPIIRGGIRADSLNYKGKVGKDALTLLKEKVTVQQDKSGMVVAINGRKADNSKREYWAFYVNGKMATVGAADYKTQNIDTIQWRIEKY